MQRISLRTSTVGRESIVHHEGVRLKSYRCPAGVWTIGVGHTGADVKPGQAITRTRAMQLLTADLRRFERAVNESVIVPLNQNQFDALVSFTFNIGVGAFKRSTLLRELNAGHYDRVPAQLMRWNKLRVHGVLEPSNGLTKRRRAEAGMWRGLTTRKKHVATADIPEPPQGRSLPELAKSSRQTQAGGGAAVIGVTALVDTVAEVNTMRWQLSELINSQTILSVALIAFGAFVIWRRWHDSHHGRAY